MLSVYSIVNILIFVHTIVFSVEKSGENIDFVISLPKKLGIIIYKLNITNRSSTQQEINTLSSINVLYLDKYTQELNSC